MGRLIILIGIAFAGLMIWQKYQKQNPEERKKFLMRTGFWALLAILVLLAVTGRIHWIGAAITALIPLVRSLFGLAVRVIPFLAEHKQQQQTGTEVPASANLDEEEAWKILGLQPGACKEDIILAHKKLIQKLHPDRGGNDYLAARINLAKDLLIKKWHA